MLGFGHTDKMNASLRMRSMEKPMTNLVRRSNSRGHYSRLFTGIVLACLVFTCDNPQALNQGSYFRSDENVLRYDIQAPITDLSPLKAEASGSTAVFPFLYSYLLLLDLEGNLTPDLASKWIYDRETLTWTIEIRDDAFFHNGQQVTAKDVVYSLSHSIRRSRSKLDERIRRYAIESDTRLKIVLHRDDPGLLKKIWFVAIIPRAHQGETGTGKAPVGSGPFRFVSRYGEKEVVLAANPDFYSGPPKLERVVITYQPQKEKSWLRLLSGETDIAQEISPKNYQITNRIEDRFRFNRYPLWFYSMLLFNCRDPLFTEPGVRRALSMAIDRDYIVDRLLKGYALVANGPIGVGSDYHHPQVKPVTYDPVRSRQLLAAAGWHYLSEDRSLRRRGQKFEFTLLLFKESQIEKRIARYIQICLNELGIRVHLQAADYKQVKSQYLSNRRFQAVLTELNGVYTSPDILIDIWGTDDQRLAWAGGFDYPEVNGLLNQLALAADPTERKEIVHALEQLITALHPGAFLFHKLALDAMSKRFHLPHAFSLSVKGIRDLKDVELSHLPTSSHRYHTD